jgi:uncharacterized protein YjbI with pentapeptide repeats
MANEEHVAILKLGVAHWNGWRRHNTHVEIDLREAILTDVDFSDANLSGADLTKANLSGAKLHDVNLSGANLANANLSGASLASADLSEAFLRYVDFSKASLLLANFSGADLTYANLTGTNLFKANFSGAKLADANLGKAFVSEADLSGASLVKANFSESNLAGANVSGANLTEANLSTSRITGIKWAPRNMRGKYLGVRGLDSTPCSSAPLPIRIFSIRWNTRGTALGGWLFSGFGVCSIMAGACCGWLVLVSELSASMGLPLPRCRVCWTSAGAPKPGLPPSTSRSSLSRRSVLAM